MNKGRADKVLVELGVFETRAKAQAAIEAGRVKVEGVVLKKAAQAISPGAQIEAEAAHPYVSRAALKLVGGLDAFSINPEGLICLDIGASTGGFTQVLLERGAAKVYAVDVGRDQLHDQLKSDPRVIRLESQDARTLTPAQILEAPELVVCDASFIGLEKVLETPLKLAKPGANLVALFKPQFQVGRENIGKGGIVKNTAAVETAADQCRTWLRHLGWRISGWEESPIQGGDGNQEYLIAAQKEPA